MRHNPYLGLKTKDSLINLRINNELKKELQQIAVKSEMTLSELINIELRRIIQRERKRVI